MIDLSAPRIADDYKFLDTIDPDERSQIIQRYADALEYFDKLIIFSKHDIRRELMEGGYANERNSE